MLSNQDSVLNFQRDFITTFERFCSFIETGKISNAKEFLQSIRLHLLSIYHCGLQLPSDSIPSDEDYPDQFTSEDIESILLTSTKTLTDNRYYWEVFDPTDEADKEPVCGDLIDDLRDIYKDIKNSLSLFFLNTEEAKATAMWQFEFQFRTHWGDHCINAIRACHYLLKE